ncbi:ATP-binding protein [Paucibacter sp. KBW04]|uniref:ATP-binding protein n=1 Tax=Paucibacter sp. KBW04 TaxID=2153361 RepID=UPI000F55D3F1|nr:ATP-binding protein [Paucibacter sp. KBW04]
MSAPQPELLAQAADPALPSVGPSRLAAERQQSLQGFRQDLDASIKRSATVLLVLVMLGAAAQVLSLALQLELPWSLRLSRMASGSLFFGVAALALLMIHRFNLRWGVGFFCCAAMLLQFGSALIYGTGLHASGMVAMVAWLAVMGLLVGPRAVQWATPFALLGFLILWQAEAQGLIGPMELSMLPPLASYAVVFMVSSLVVGWLSMRYGSLFWEVTSSLESSRQLLTETLHAQQLAAQDLRESEDRLRVLLDNSLSCIVILDGETAALRFANAQTLKTFGCERASELDSSLLFPGGPYSREQAMLWVRRTLDQGAQYFEWQSRHSDGSPIWWDLKLDRLLIGGESCVVSFGHDITERVRAESELRIQRSRLEEQVRERTSELMLEKQRLLDIIEALPITLSIRDLQGRYTLINRSFEQASGHRRDQVLGLSARHFLTPEMAAEIADTDAQVMAGAASATTESQFIHPVEGAHDYLIVTVPLLDGRKKPYAVLNLGTDVTSLKRLQRELSQAKDEAERLARVKSEFLANMSHEIRTPLNAVLGLAQLGIGRSADPAAARNGFERIVRSGRHLLSVINDILDYSKVESGKLEIDSQPANLSQLSKEVIGLVAERAEAKHLGLQLDYKLLSDWVAIDALRVTQILVNLLANAIKFTDQGEVRLSVSQKDDYLLLSVIDTGVGIAPEQQSRIFKAFEQADSSITRQFGGTGLGLSISNRLAQAMGGLITVTSTLGKGSCFTLRLPWVQVKAEDQHEAPPLRMTGPDLLRGLRILIVDDVDINREILHDLLTLAGAEVMSADGGPQAIARVQEAGPDGYDLVLMDVQMPEMDGYEATRCLHQMAPQLRVIALTAHALPEEKRKCAEAGMQGHISKPIDQAELMRTLLTQAEPLERRGPGGLRPSQFAALDELPAAGERAAAGAETRAEALPSKRSDIWPDLPGTDFDTALTRCAGRQELLAKLLGTFAKQYAQYQSVFEEARISGLPALGSAAHRLKGLSGNLGMLQLSSCAERLEVATSSRGDPADVPAALTALIREIAPMVSAIVAWHEAYTAKAGS